jgi:hypothetical protein
MNWYVNLDDGHYDINTRGCGRPILAPPTIVQVLVAQQARMDAVLRAWAIVAGNSGPDPNNMKQYENRVSEYLSNEVPYSRG